MGKKMSETKFKERLRKYKSKETAEALTLAYNMAKDLANKYQSFKIYFTEQSAGFYRKGKPKNDSKSYFFIEVSKKGKRRDLFFGGDNLWGKGISEEIIDRAKRYSGSLDLRKAASKKRQVELFFECFGEIIRELDRYN